MSLATLLNQPLTIVRRAAATTDEYGNEVPGTTATTETVGAIQPMSSTEVLLDRETYASTFKCFLPPDTEIDGSDQIVADGVTYEVVGQPARWWNPRLRAAAQVECVLRVTTG